MYLLGGGGEWVEIFGGINTPIPPGFAPLHICFATLAKLTSPKSLRLLHFTTFSHEIFKICV